MTEIANEPEPRSNLLRACELLESFIAGHAAAAHAKPLNETSWEK
jgi:hypothetical protein